MDILSKDDIRLLLETDDQPCVSLFMPTEQAGKETRQNAIRYKNLLRDTEERLKAYGLPHTEIQAMLKPAQAMLDDSIFWQHQSNGLAIFCSKDMFRSYRLPLDLEELVVVADRFHMKPVLPMLTGNDHFYILALSQNAVRLLHASQYTVNELDLPEDMSKNLSEAIGADDPERQLQFHTAGSSAKGSGAEGAGAPLYHGHADPDERVNLLRYFLEVDRGISSVLHDEQAPLVLAGVDYLLPLYRERNSYKHLLDDAVLGNPDTLKPEELQAQAWDVVQPHFSQALKEAEEQYHENLAHEQASGDIRTVVPAATYGKVDRLFVAVGVHQWGSFDATNNSVEIHQQQEPGKGDVDLLDTAALNTILNGGTVYAVNPDEVPGQGVVAAIFRY